MTKNKEKLVKVEAVCTSMTGEFQIEWNGQFMFALGWLVLVLSIGAIGLLNLLIRSGSAVNVASLFYLTPPTTAPAIEKNSSSPRPAVG